MGGFALRVDLECAVPPSLEGRLTSENTALHAVDSLEIDVC
jgi:hypothetical protein